MKKALLAGAVIVFAGVAATVAVASDHKAKPAAPAAHHSVMIASEKSASGHKSPAKRHHAVKRHHAAPRTHGK